MTQVSDRPFPAQRDLRSRTRRAQDESGHGADARDRDCPGLLHDVGHGLATVALLLEAARSEATPAHAGRLLDLAEDETSRLLATVHRGLGAAGPDEPVIVEPTAVRPVLERIVQLAEHSRSTSVTLAAGADAVVAVDPTALWRIVGNLVDNAVRAAGPAGHVELALVTGSDGAPVIEVVDDGPGFRGGSPGVAGIGLNVVTGLLAAHGGRLEIDGVRDPGSRVRVVLPVPPRRGPAVPPRRGPAVPPWRGPAVAPSPAREERRRGRHRAV